MGKDRGLFEALAEQVVALLEKDKLRRDAARTQHRQNNLYRSLKDHITRTHHLPSEQIGLEVHGQTLPARRNKSRD